MAGGTIPRSRGRIIQQVGSNHYISIALELCSRGCLCGVITKTTIHSLMCVLLLLSWGLIAYQPSPSTSFLYPGDVVLTSSVPGFFHKYVLLTSDGNFEPTYLYFQVYYTEKYETNSSTYNTTELKRFSCPQGLMVNNSHQNYLVKGSQLQFKFNIHNPSAFSNLAKICQFSDIHSYREIVDAENNDTIIAAERKGDCIKVSEVGSNFKIENNGYYWYVLSIPKSPNQTTVYLLTTYEYRLTKVFFNTSSLGNPQACTFTTGKKGECTISDSVFLQRSTKHVLASLKAHENSDPYSVKVQRRTAIGLALLVFSLCTFLYFTVARFC